MYRCPISMCLSHDRGAEGKMLFTFGCCCRSYQPKMLSCKAVLPPVPKCTAVESTNCPTPSQIDPSEARCPRTALVASCDAVTSNNARPHSSKVEHSMRHGAIHVWAAMHILHVWAAMHILLRLMYRVEIATLITCIASIAQHGRSLSQPNILAH